MSDTENRDNAADGGLRPAGLFCPLGPMADAEAFGNLLVRHGLIDALAIDDAEYYDGFRTSGRVIEAYNEISKHLTARAEEAIGKVKAVMEEIQSRQNADVLARGESSTSITPKP